MVSSLLSIMFTIIFSLVAVEVFSHAILCTAVCNAAGKEESQNDSYINMC